MLNKNEYEWLDLIAMQEAWHSVFRDKGLMSVMKRCYMHSFRTAHQYKHEFVRRQVRNNFSYNGPLPRFRLNVGYADIRQAAKLKGRAIAKYIAGEKIDNEDLHALWRTEVPMYVKFKVPALKAVNDMREKRYSGEWEKPVWDSIEQGDPLYILHCVHISEEDKSMVAYTQSIDKLMRGIQTRVKPGRYLKKFYPEMSDEEIRRWAHIHGARTKAHKITEIGNDDPDGWVKAYSFEVQASDSNSMSCMQGEECVRVYACPKNDLVLLVVQTELEDGLAVIARAIGNRKKKQFVRAYTNRHCLSSNTFIKMLEAAGWEENRGCLVGQKLEANEGDDNNYECPYIDGDYKHVRYSCGYLVIGDDGLAANNTNGYTGSGYDETCSDCGCGLSEDEAYYADDYGPFCPDCYNERFVEAKGRNGRWVTAERDECVEVDGEWYVEEYLGDNDIYMCDLSDDYHHLDDLVRLACGSMACDGRPDITRLDEESKGEEAMWAHEADVVTLSDGRVVYYEDAQEWQAEINDELWAEALDEFVTWQEESNEVWCDALDEMMGQLHDELENHFESVKRDPRKWPEVVQGLLDRQGELDLLVAAAVKESQEPAVDVAYQAAVTDAVEAGYLPVSVVRQEDARLEAQEVAAALRSEKEEQEEPVMYEKPKVYTTWPFAC